MNTISAEQKELSLKQTTNPAFLPLFDVDSRYLVLKGGGGSGKSVFAGRKVLERCIREGNHRFLVCRKVGRTLRASCFAQLRDQLQTCYPSVKAVCNRTDMRITLPESGSEIIFSGLDDAEKLKSIYNITGIWIEEASELLESDFNQLDIRLRGQTEHYKQMILSFNPVSALHWLKRRFFDKPCPGAFVHESTYKDNRYLDAEQIKVLERFKDEDEYFYSVYCLGQWGVTGKSVFPGRAVTERLAGLKPPLRTGFLSERNGFPVFEEEEHGPLRIDREPVPGRPYVIGGDTAGEGSDRFVLQCLDNITLEQAAVFIRTDIDEDVFARQAYLLGRLYNDALIALETNWSTYPVMELQCLRYPRQYVRETFDSYTRQPRQSFGFVTNLQTRPVIISNLIRLIRGDVSIVRDRTTLEEMTTFVRSESMRPEAEAGAHDDCIMALAIACHASEQQRKWVFPAVPVEWTGDMLEDYRRASPADRAALERRWGRPPRNRM